MEVHLKHYTPLHIAAEAIRECWQSQGKSDTETEFVPLVHAESGDDMSYCETVCGPNDKALIDRVGNKFKHASTLEHLNYNFKIEGISRACLQELARHRHASLSVKSTRYTLKELKCEESFYDYAVNNETSERAHKYIVTTGTPLVDAMSVRALENLRVVLKSGVTNDIAKFCLPESYKTSLAWTINARSLQNFLALRTSKAALWEIRNLANSIYSALPEDHIYLFEEHTNGK